MKNVSLLFLAGVCLAFQHQKTSIDYDHRIPQVAFAVSRIEKALTTTPASSVHYKHIALKLLSNAFEEEAYQIRVLPDTITIQASDYSGLMYGGLELAEQLSLHGKANDTRQAPFIKQRGIKINIPLDARTPSYDDTGDAAQKNIREMWSWEFWEPYLDKLAENRYNVLTLWNPHPSPSMIRQESILTLP